MTTQVPALSATTFGQASHKSVRRIGPSTSAFLTGGSGGGSGRSSSSTGISATPISDISLPRASLPAHEPPKHALGLDPRCERFGDKFVRHFNIWSAIGRKTAFHSY